MASVVSIIEGIMGVKEIVVEKLRGIFDGGDLVELHVTARPRSRAQRRCPHCGRLCPIYDGGKGKPHTWRSLDWGGVSVFIESLLPRIKCPEHGVVTAGVPWAFPKSRFTKAFDHLVAYLVGSLPKSKISDLLTIDWETVGRCVERVFNALEPDRTVRYRNLRNIGIDETSYKKGHKYITIVVDHDKKRVIWVHEGNSYEVLRLFFLELTEEQRAGIQVVSGDGADWITRCVNEFTPQASRCIDHFHVAQWAVGAIDEVRRMVVREHLEMIEGLKKKIGDAETEEEIRVLKAYLRAEKETAREIKKSKYAIGKGIENLTENQSAKLQMVTARSKKIQLAHELKELLRAILKKDDPAEVDDDLKKWLWRATHSRLEPIKKLAAKIKNHRQQILDTVRLRLSNARIEATNNKIKLLIRTGYGFRSLPNLMALILLKCSDLKPLPPRRFRKMAQSPLATG